MSTKIRVGILGATAYTGLELVQIISRHPDTEIAFVSSRSNPDTPIDNVFGELYGVCDSVLVSPEEAQTIDVDVVFSCLPHAISADLCLPFLDKGAKVIDLSADFRLTDPENYRKWYKHQHPRPELLAEAVFGLCEHNRSAIAKARLIANPGCYPTSILLPLLPLLKTPGVELSNIIADSKSGVSGAGKTLKETSLYCEANENFMAYSIGRSHRHVSEIEQELAKVAGKEMHLTFSPHLLPLNRGILSTIYIQVNRSAAECETIAREYYANEPFVRVRESWDLPRLKYVQKTNFCDIAFTGGENGQPVIVVSAIDNLQKGAAGQAVQNMNIMFGIDERRGLR